MKPVRTIGVVYGGGDAPGLKAVFRAEVRAAVSDHAVRVIGISNGFDGLIWPEGAKEMKEDSVSGILPRGGTVLGTTKSGCIESVSGDRALSKMNCVDPNSEIVHADRAVGATFGDSA